MAPAFVIALTLHLVGPGVTPAQATVIATYGAPTPIPGRDDVLIERRVVDPKGRIRHEIRLWRPNRPTRHLATGRNVAVSPEGRRIAFINPEGALVVRPIAGGARARSRIRAHRAAAPIWSEDGHHLIFRRSVRACEPDCPDRPGSSIRVHDDLLHRHWNTWDDGTRDHLFAVAAAGPADPVDLTPGPHAAPSRVLNSGRGYAVWGRDRVVFTSWRGARPGLDLDVSLWSAPLEGGPPTRVTTSTAWQGLPVVGPRGRDLAYLTHRRPGYESDRTQLMVLEPGAAARALTAGWDHPVREVAWSPRGDALFVTADARGRRPLFRIPAQGGAPTPLLPGWSVRHLRVDHEGRLLFVHSRLDAPPAVYRFTPGGDPPRRLSEALDVGPVGAVRPRTVPTPEGPVHGFVVTPPDFDPARRYPLLVLIHGGPQGAHRDEWHPRWTAQVFASNGFVVALPNPRGSVGYGQRFTDAVRGDWGGGPYRDVMAFTEAVAAEPWVDGARVCAAGASYGGYLVSWIAGHSDRFACLIAHAPVFNLESFWGDTEELWFPEWEFGGPPWRARGTYERWSPHRYIHRASTPTLVTHGDRDYRVPLSHGLQLFTALRRRGVPARLATFPDEGHWIRNPANQVAWFEEVLAWMNRFVGRPSR